MAFFIFDQAGSPAPFWQSLVSPGITFAGTLVVVWLTNKYASKNMRQQRELDEKRFREQWKREDEVQREQRLHEAAEAMKERTTQKRRDVCLRAIDALARYQAHLPTMATRFEEYDAKPVQDFLACAAQVELVVEPTAAMAVRKLVSAVGRMNMKLMIKRMPLVVLNEERARLQKVEKRDLDIENKSKLTEQTFNKQVTEFYEDIFLQLKALIPERVAVVTALRNDLELTIEDQIELREYLERDANEILRLFYETVDAAHNATDRSGSAK